MNAFGSSACRWRCGCRRLCANTGADLHLVRPLGFELDDKKLRRAGLDYHEYARIAVHDDLAAFVAAVAPRRLFAVSTRGRVRYDEVAYANDDAMLFGPETRGLPQSILDDLPPEQRLRLPMRPGNRSLNLSNAVCGDRVRGVAADGIRRQRGLICDGLRDRANLNSSSSRRRPDPF